MPAMKSLLFVPGDRPERFAKAAASGADALILDLEDSVTADRKALARAAIAEHLRSRPAGPALFVRVNPLGSDFQADDLDALAGLSPAGLMIPKAEGARSIATVDRLLDERGLGGVPLLPIATETPLALFHLGSYAEIPHRLVGLTWGAEDLPAAVGAASSREADGSYTPPYEMARALTLFAAHAAEVAAIDTVYPDFRNLEGLAAYAARAMRDGFNGMMAIHPTQVPVINAAFTPSTQAVERARAILAAFAANPGVGAIQLDGAMIDAPHRKQAERILRAVSAD